MSMPDLGVCASLVGGVVCGARCHRGCYRASAVVAVQARTTRQALYMHEEPSMSY